jgi:putative transposase
MFLPRYVLDEIHFSFRCYVYFRWHTYRRRPMPALKRLTPGHLEAVHPDIHVLELNASDTDMALLASLRPTESVSGAAGKLKGAASKVLRQLEGGNELARILGGGYFAATIGTNTTDELDHYLDRQGEHHGYHERTDPPVFVRTWPFLEADRSALQTPHAVTLLRWHIVFSTWNRQGVFSREAGEAVGECWERHSDQWRIRLLKISVVPDHVHVAISSHPTVAPAEVIVSMLNASQELVQNHYDSFLIKASIPRLWKPGAYVGSFGDLTKDHIRNYLRDWERRGQLT